MHQIWTKAIFLSLAVLGMACQNDNSDGAQQGKDSEGPSEGLDTEDASPGGTATVCCPLGSCANVGDACINGACVPKSSGCYLDSECPKGAFCEDAQFCACGDLDCTAKSGTCRYPEGCCNGNGDCGEGSQCLNGQCYAPSSGNGCWNESDCESGKACEGAILPACGDLQEAQEGICAVPGICCADDRECGSGVCRGGRCLEASKVGQCWNDDECDGGLSCLGASLCECSPSNSSPNQCAPRSAPGICGTGSESCCTKDNDCGKDNICVQGSCVDKIFPESGKCFLDEHCGPSATCEGAELCHCDDENCAESQAGSCRARPIFCDLDSECPTAMHCISPDQSTCREGESGQGICVETLEYGCWDSSDCNQGERCAGEWVCIDEEGCDLQNKPGVCAPLAKRGDCCDSQNDCIEGFECRNSDSSKTCPPNGTAVCVPRAEHNETCWNKEDCHEGLMCSGVWICACGGKCYFNRTGYCMAPTNCDSDVDCSDGEVCARDEECWSSPCTTASTCRAGGRCQAKIEGACWSHAECGEGEYCDGLKVCPADTDCLIPDQPGQCAKRAGLGECCSSYKGCEPSLRCVSVAEKTGCVTDFTSVCLPAVTYDGACYADDDCDPNQRCEGQKVCPCGVESCEGEAPIPGTCVAR